jgi:hypothetical protein
MILPAFHRHNPHERGLGTAPLPGRRLPPAFRLRVVTIPAGQHRDFSRAEWADAIIIVGHGTVDLECLDGARQFFCRGDLLWLHDLPLRALRNQGPDPVVLVAVSRRPP